MLYAHELELWIGVQSHAFEKVRHKCLVWVIAEVSFDGGPAKMGLRNVLEISNGAAKEAAIPYSILSPHEHLLLSNG